ncbi:MAG: shikimate kinase, partial [Acidimicrobiia bacterium]|nr:shikimate kinase [Acidimicrobiia bacterium]
VGMMGSGKTRTGRIVAERTGHVFVDTDAEIVRVSGASISEIFESVGEETFRDLEEHIVSRVAGGSKVISTGGGVVLRDVNIETMRATGTVIWLNACPETLANRVRSGEGRPLIEGESDMVPRLRRILSERRERYLAAAHHVVDTDRIASDGVPDIVEALWLA